MIRAAATCLLVLALAAPALAGPPSKSLRPVARATAGENSAPAPAPAQQAPAGTAVQEQRPAAPEAEASKRQRKGLFSVLRPKQRSAKVQAFAGKKKRELQKGAICGDLALQGEPVGQVPGRISGCGVADAVKLRSVSGIPLSQGAVMDCTTAKALKSWVDKGLRPAVGRKGGGVAQIRVAAHYSCRTRNNQKGAKISEHGRGRAIDISGFRLANGAEVSVLQHWGSGWEGTALKAMHKRACGPFGTVLGPNADRYHRDHFHFDTARYRSGSYCK